MKKLVICILPLFFASCFDNHNHDGKYHSTVFTDASMSWVQDEVIELDGNNLNFQSISISKAVLEEIKSKCIQFPDRVEFKDKNGMTRVLRVSDDGNLKYGEYIYKKIQTDTTFKSIKSLNSITEEEEKSDIKRVQESNAAYSHSIKAEKKYTIEKNDSEEEIGIFIEKKDVNPDSFIVTAIGDIFYIKVIDMPEDKERIIYSVTLRKDGRLINLNGKETEFKLLKDVLYRKVKEKWQKFENQQCRM